MSWSLVWEAILWTVTAFVFIAYLMALFSIITDLFRDRKLGGVAKAVWLFFLMFMPFLTALIYLIARGGGMAERAAARQSDFEARLQGSPSEEIARARQLLDNGVITEEEYAALKSAALARIA